MTIINSYPSGDPLNAPIHCNILPASPGDLVYYSLSGPPEINPSNLVTNPIVIGSISDTRGLEYNIWARSQGEGKEPSEVVQWTLVTEIPECVPASYNWYADMAWGDFSQSWENADGAPAGVMNVMIFGNWWEYGDFLGAILVVTIDGVEVFNDCCGIGNFQLAVPANAKNFTARMHQVGCLNPLGTMSGNFNIFYVASCGGGAQ